MAVDLEAIKKKLLELSGQRRNSNIQLWKPGPGEYKVRGLPWKNADPSTPFKELYFYYLGNGPGILAPNQFGKPDPINDLIRKCYNSGKPEDRLLAKKLHSKMRAYMPIIVRGQEDKAVQVWSFGKQIYSKLLTYYTNEEVGDILDPKEGFDLNVFIKQQPGKQFQDTDVEAARRPRSLSDDAAQAKTWLEAVPDLGDMYKLKSEQEIKTLLQNWLDGGAASTDQSDGTSRGPVSNDELDKLVSEVKAEVKTDTEAPAKAKAKAKKIEASEPAEKKSLDDAFAELMKDE